MKTWFRGLKPEEKSPLLRKERRASCDRACLVKVTKIDKVCVVTDLIHSSRCETGPFTDLDLCDAVELTKAQQDNAKIIAQEWAVNPGCGGQKHLVAKAFLLAMQKLENLKAKLERTKTHATEDRIKRDEEESIVYGELDDAYEELKAENLRLKAMMAQKSTLCSLCKEPQFDTPSGVTCKNGHGGAPSL